MTTIQEPEPVPDDVSSGVSLEGRLDAVLESTEGIRREIKIENERRDALDKRRVKTIRRVTQFASAVALVAVIGVGVGIRGEVDAHRAQLAATKAEHDLVVNQESTTRARKASCDQDNNQRARAEKAFEDNAAVIVAQLRLVNPHPTPNQQQGYLDYLAAQHRKGIADFPQRDCSPGGIASFLNTPQPTP